MFVFLFRLELGTKLVLGAVCDLAIFGMVIS